MDRAVEEEEEEEEVTGGDVTDGVDEEDVDGGRETRRFLPVATEEDGGAKAPMEEAPARRRKATIRFIILGVSALFAVAPLRRGRM
jgi:hypothetical protein